MVKAKKIIPWIAAVCVAAALSVTAYAYFSGSLTGTATAQTGTVDVKLNESFPATDDNGAPLNTVKTFSGANTGNKMSYVRAHIFPTPEYDYTGVDSTGSAVNEWRPLPLPTSDFVLTVNSPDWVDGGDGYLYYDEVLNPGASTSTVSVTVALADGVTLPEGMDIRLDVRVELETVQASNNMYQTVWGLTNLPSGVEAFGS